MNQLVEDVTEFHRRLGFPVAEGATAPVLCHRLALIDEEAAEVRAALQDLINSVVEDASSAEALKHVVHELIDLTYVIAGAFVELGIDPQPAWDAVHMANLQKAAPPDGGKAIKPAGWRSPVIPVVPLVFANPDSQAVRSGAR
jgi:predicted HAD superfamily Cof-like phosphohydrolase